MRSRLTENGEQGARPTRTSAPSAVRTARSLGDLHARLEAIDSITLSAEGSLSIDNLTLHALNISLWGGQSFAMSDTVHLEHAGSFEWVPGHITITQLTPVFLNLTPAVPEPTTVINAG